MERLYLSVFLFFFSIVTVIYVTIISFSVSLYLACILFCTQHLLLLLYCIYCFFCIAAVL